MNAAGALCYSGPGDGAEGWVEVRQVRSNFCGGFGAVFLTVTLAIAVAGCSFNTKLPQAPAVDPNLYPQNYRRDVAIFLSQQLLDLLPGVDVRIVADRAQRPTEEQP